jgi:transcriptional regulator with XRE-family HTH domain
MDRTKLLKKIGEKLQGIRQSLNLKNSEMADRIGIDRSTYYKYELGVNNPQLTFLYQLGQVFDISMDWLILDHGPIHNKEKEIPTSEIVPPIAREKDVKELLDYMERVPLFRHEVLVMLYKFKDQYKAKDAPSTNDQSGQ